MHPPLRTCLRSLLQTLLVVCAALYPTGLDAQKQALNFQVVEPEDQVMTVNQYFCLQDAQGFVWTAGPQGLDRHDGYQVRRFRYDPDDPFSVASNSVRAMAEAPDGSLWVTTENAGICRYLPTQERFDRIQVSSHQDLGWVSDVTDAIAIYQDSLLVVGTDQGLVLASIRDLQDIHQLRFRALPAGLVPEGVTIWETATDHAGNLWVGHSKGCSVVPAAHLLGASDAPAIQLLPGISSRAVTRGPDHTMWVGSMEGLFRASLDPDKGLEGIDLAPIPSLTGDHAVFITVLVLDHLQNLWVGTRGDGLVYLPVANVPPGDLAELSPSFYAESQFQFNSLNSHQINHMMEDRTGNLWLCTYGNLYRINPRHHQFHHTFASDEEMDQSWSNTIFAIYQDASGRRWLGSKAGISRFDPQTGQTSLIKLVPEEPASPSNVIRTILPYGPDSLFVTTLGGLWVGPRAGERFQRFELADPELQGLIRQRLFGAIQDQNGHYWMGSTQGLFHLDPVSRSLRLYEHDEQDPHSIARNFVRVIMEDKEGNLWIGTDQGLDLLSAGKRLTGKAHFEHFRHEAGNASSLSSDEVRALSTSQDGRIWVGTDGGGLNLLDPATGKCLRFTEEDGLSNNTVYALAEDADHRLWISTNNGLSCLSGDRTHFDNFNQNDGLQGNEFNVRAAFQSAQGELFFGGINGFNHFFPQDIRANPYIPEVRFIEFSVANKVMEYGKSDLLKKPIAYAPEIRLDWRDNLFSVSFAAMDFSNPTDNQFMYRMEGFRDDWFPLRNDHKVTFTNLDPGRYTLEVKASNGNGQWSKEAARLDIIVVPPPWRTWWAYTLYALCLIGLTTFILRNRFRRIRLTNQLEIERLQKEKLQEIEAIKSNFLANVSHELRTPLTLILGPLDKLRSEAAGTAEQELLDLARNNGQRLMDLINQLLDAARMEAGKSEANWQEISVRELLRGLHRDFGTLAQAKHLQLELAVPAGLPVLLCDPDMLTQMLYNLLSNALKFTPEGGQIRLEAAPGMGQGLDISVSNTGPGIAADEMAHLFDRFYQAQAGKAQLGTGLGLALVKEMMVVHQGEVTVHSQPGEWTRFTLSFPNVLPAGAQLQGAEPVADPVAAPEGEPEPLTGSESPGLPSVLLVEDDQELRGFIAAELGLRYQVYEAGDGAEALPMALELVPDLVVTDLMMPRMDGVELCQQLKANRATSHIPVLMLTARSADESKLEGLEAGADDYLTKPFQMEELLLRLRNRMLQRERFHAFLNRQPDQSADSTSSDDAESEFVRQAREVVHQHLDASDFAVEDLSEAMALSSKQLQRKLKALTGKSPNQFIRHVRLEEAARMLSQTDLNISEIAYQVGFSSPSYFSKCFLEQFGQTPSEARER